jgi:predicted esterase
MWFVAGGSALVVASVITYTTASGSPEQPADEPQPFTALPDGFCAKELLPLTDSACFAAPASAVQPTPLVVYLHGRFPITSLSEELDRQSRVARLATARGFAVLAVRGAQGECTNADMKDWYCWPSNEKNADDGPRFVTQKLLPAMHMARERIGTGPNVLLGFSNGGYFATLIAKRSLASFDAIAVAHGGPIRVESTGRTAPMLLITADDDPSDPEMRRLDDELTRSSWPHALVAREGIHGLPDWDIDTALTFFHRVRSEKLPLNPPLASRSRPRAAVVDGGEDDDADGE